LKPINKSRAFASLSQCLDVLDIIQKAEIKDLQGGLFFVKKASFSISFTARKWHTVGDLLKLLRRTGKLDEECHRITQRASSRRQRGTADLPLTHNGLIHIYARNDCFDSEQKDEELYSGYVGTPNCKTKEPIAKEEA